MSDPRSIPAGEEEALVLRGVSKTFPGQLALDGVDMTLTRGQVRALLGENGSGKSTLIKILAGYHHPDPGWEAWVDGSPFQLGSASAAREAGIRFIHQDLGLVDDLDVIDNLALGEEYVGRRWLNHRREAEEAERLLDGYGIQLDVSAPVRSLSPAERTIVAVVRALREGVEGKILVLDEPTASLSGAEVARLFQVVRSVRDQGGSLLYVTHRLQEVFEIADSVTVLRDGAKVDDRPVAGLSESDLVDMLIGRSLASVPPAPSAESVAGAAVALEARSIFGGQVHGVSLRVHRGEVLGVAGINGSGRDELPYLLYGARAWESGEVQIGQQRFDPISIGDSISNGVAFAGADRAHDSVIAEMTVRENLTLPQIPRSDFAWWLSIRGERRDARGWLERFDIRPPDPDRLLETLSGGNQQRVVLARWLRCEPQVLLLEEPTRGVDIGAKADIYEVIAGAATEGKAFIVFSSDAEELAKICSRVIVLRDGAVAAELTGEAITEETVVEQTIIERKATA